MVWAQMRYFTSVGYLGQDGNIDNFTYRRYNLRTNIETQLAKNFQLSLGVAGNVGKRETPGYASGGTDSNSTLGEQGWLSVAHQTIMMHPYLPKNMMDFIPLLHRIIQAYRIVR
ncbi:hypothetical protein NXX55_27820 [Bacteroides thetaiotaomicron]|nr:hypothetical protein [Bacteroides thetaiotaomicron]